MVFDARRRYGDDVAEALAGTLPDVADPAWFTVCAQAPMLEFVLRGSLGVVVHSAWAAAMVEGHTLGTVAVAPLPLLPSAPPAGVNPPALADVPDDAVVVVTVGSVNANRRIDWIIEAVAGDAGLRDRVHVVAAGSVSDQMQRSIAALAKRIGMVGRVHLTGRVGDEELSAIIARADVCAALRDPVLEAKSASLLSQMRAGKPVIVFDHAHYSELPDHVVAKVPVDGGVDALARSIRMLADDLPAAAQLGARAKEYAETIHTPLAYGAAIVAAGERAMAARPLADLTAGLAQRLDRLGLAGDRQVQATLADTVFDLLGPE
jgi:glycosyltransferase involved in cell wall biosynthesis